VAVQTLYKLTDQDGYTRRGAYNECLWGPGVTHSGTGQGELCGSGYIHAYTNPLLAVLLNPSHANIASPILWECEGEIVKDDKGLKCGCISLTAIKEVPIPVITNEQRIKFSILCAMEVCKNPYWTNWAKNWLSGKDRTAYAAAYAAARAAARAAYAAARAAARAADAARAAAYAADAARAAAYAAYAAYAASPLDLIKLATLAMEE
jgi:hypothetical protein